MTPQAHIAALKQLHVSIGFESNKLAGVLSTVTVPDDAAAKISISGVIKDALSRPPESWADLEDGAEAEEEPALHAQEAAPLGRVLLRALRRPLGSRISFSVYRTSI